MNFAKCLLFLLTQGLMVSAHAEDVHQHCAVNADGMSTCAVAEEDHTNFLQSRAFQTRSDLRDADQAAQGLSQSDEDLEEEQDELDEKADVESVGESSEESDESHEDVKEEEDMQVVDSNGDLEEESDESYGELSEERDEESDEDDEVLEEDTDDDEDAVTETSNSKFQTGEDGADLPTVTMMMSVAEVKKAVVPWSAEKTRYSFKTCFCKTSNVSTCCPKTGREYQERRRSGGPFARRRAGCVKGCTVFKTDCSGLVRWSLVAGTRRRDNAVFKKLSASMRRRNEQRRRNNRVTPLAMDFYEAFKTAKSGDPWRQVKLKLARPGDVLAERYRLYKKPGSTGHVLIVVAKPKFNRIVQGMKEYTVKIVDSANSGHARDTRAKCKNRKCGVGFGYMHLYTAKTSGAITGYQWKAGHRRRRSGISKKGVWTVGRFTR